MARYRPNVAGIFTRKNGKIWIGERIRDAGAWQFPQGGVDGGECLIDGFFREMREEVGIQRAQIRVLSSRGGYRYRYTGGHRKDGYAGQEQTYFLCRVRPQQIDFRTAKPEFQAARWIRPEEFQLAWVAKFKRKVYRTVFQDFFGIALEK